MAGLDVRQLGDYIREQRDASDISLRQLAKLAGVSNPYLSQIERGLRKPSAEILQQIAKALRISAEALYVQAGILEQRQGDGQVADAIHTDSALNERQKQVLLEIYESFRRETAAALPTDDTASVSVITTTDLLAPVEVGVSALTPASTSTKPRTPRKRAARSAAPADPVMDAPPASPAD